MTDSHPDPSPELRKFARAVLDVLVPLGEALAAGVPPPTGEQSSCQQAWCPVCAMAALVCGEQHPMTTVVAEYAAVLVSMLGAVADHGGAPDPPSKASHGGMPPPPAPGRYQHIPVIVHD